MRLSNIDIVELENVSLPAKVSFLMYKQIQLKESKEAYFNKHPLYDWQRIAYVLSKIQRGNRYLEIGPGRGYFTTLVHRSNFFREMNVVDIVDRQKRMPASVHFDLMSVASLSYPDGHFDTVVCMEVLEHLTDTNYSLAVNELRRVSNKQLLIAVPFNEPMPSKFHLQKFDSNRISTDFQSAKIEILVKKPIMRVPWVLIEENF